MKITYSAVRNPRWSNSDRTAIDCVVKFDHFKQEVGFTASHFDTEPHGQEIFARCARGEFGPVDQFMQQSVPNSAVKTFTSTWPGWPKLQEFIGEANAEIHKGTIRGIVLVWASMIDEMLGEIIEAFLIDHSVSRDVIWDDSHSSLRSFSGRAK